MLQCVSDSRQTLGGERPFEDVVGIEIPRKIVGIDAGVQTRKFVAAGNRLAPTEELDQFVEDLQVPLRSRIRNDVEGLAPLCAADEPRQTDA